MTTQIEKNEKAEVTEYFNGTGFDRWNRIYSESDDVNKVQKNIRIGHQKTVDDVISWLKEYDNCLLYTSPSPRDQRGSRMPSSA